MKKSEFKNLIKLFTIILSCLIVAVSYISRKFINSSISCKIQIIFSGSLLVLVYVVVDYYAKDIENHINNNQAQTSPNKFTTKTNSFKKNKKLTRQDKINNQFNSSNGCHINLTKLIKFKIDNPSSYKHVFTKYNENNNFISVSTYFKSKDLEGVETLKSFHAIIDIEGNIIDILNID